MKIDNRLILENSKSLKVLYVEDDTTLRDSTAKLFRNFFKGVDVAIDGKDGYEKYQDYLEREKVPYDIVISDINMPNLNGLEMCEKIKDICFEQVVIFITAFNEVNYLQEAIKIGVNGFLTKPIEGKELKKVLYTSSQIVADRKLLQEYYRQIEDVNDLGVNLVDSSAFNSAEDILDDLVLNREKISHLWMSKKAVNEKLKTHSIDIEFFRSHYAIKVIEYFLSVIRGDEKIGNCPVIFIMLDFFRNKHLSLEDIFMICVAFKNTMSAYIFKKYSFNHKLFDNISLILDKNFEGVIVNYLKIKENIPKVIEVKESTVVESIVVKPEEDINYIEYVIESDIYELQELEDDIDTFSISVTQSNKSTVENCVVLGSSITRYGNILSVYPLFAELGKSINKLGVNFTDNAELLLNDKERMLNISTLLEGFVNDLIVWRKEIFENNIANPHFLNSSFFSNVDTIIMFIEYNESDQVVDNDFEDDVFF